MAANEDLTPSNRYCIKNLTAGDLLRVRVVAVNPGGRSEPGTLPDPVPIREIVGESPPNGLFSQPRPLWTISKRIIPGVLNNLALHIIVPRNSETSPDVRHRLWCETAFKRLPLTSLSAAPPFAVSDNLSLKYSCCAQEGREGVRARRGINCL